MRELKSLCDVEKWPAVCSLIVSKFLALIRKDVQIWKKIGKE